MPRFSSNEVRWLYDQFATSIDEGPQIPYEDKLRLLVLHVSEGCNLGCTYCFADKGQYGNAKKKFMSPELTVDAVRTALQRYGRVGTIKLFGGEPLLNLAALEALSDFLDQCKTNDSGFESPRITLVSNMTIGSARALNWIRRAKPTITGSIDGPKELHNKFRIYPKGGGSFDTVDATIRLMLAECGQPAALECVYSPHHFEAGLSISDVHHWIVDRYGVTDVLVHPMGLIGDSKDLVSERQWRSYSESLPELSKAYGSFLLARKNTKRHPIRGFVEEVFWKYQTDSHCDLGVNNLTVNASGKVYPCYTLLAEPQHEMGSVKDMKVGDDFKRVQATFLAKTKDSIEACRTCDIRRTCHSCPGEMNSLEGSMEIPSSNSCNFMLGVVEGGLLKINEMRANELEWSHFKSALISPPRSEPLSQSRIDA